MGYTADVSVNWSGKTSVNHLIEMSRTALDASYFDATSPSAVSQVAHAMAVHGFSEISSSTGFPFKSIAPAVMFEVLKELTLRREGDVGGFSDLDQVLQLRNIEPNGLRFLFTAVLQAWLAGNTSNKGRLGFPAECKVSPLPPFDSYPKLVVEAIRKVTPSLFNNAVADPRADSLNSLPSHNSKSPGFPTVLEETVSPAQAAMESRLLDNMLKKNKRAVRLTGAQVLRMIAQGMPEIRRFQQLTNFCDNIELMLDNFERHKDPNNPLAPPFITCVQAGDLKDQIESLKDDSPKGKANPYEILAALEEIPQLKSSTTTLIERLDAQSAHNKKLRSIANCNKRAGGDDLDIDQDVEHKIDSKLGAILAKQTKAYGLLGKQILSAVKSTKRGAPSQQSDDDDSTTSTNKKKKKHKKEKGGPSPKPGRKGWSDLVKILEAKFPTSSKKECSAKVFEVLDSRCIYCKAATSPNPSGKGVRCSADCGKTELNGDIVRNLKQVTSV